MTCIQGSSYVQSQTTTIPELISYGRDVTYSCGSCGYSLNLRSSSRNTTNIGSKYGKAMRKGVVAFFSIDESRFTQIDELPCLPFFQLKFSRRLLPFRRRTRLLCRKCGSVIGYASPTGSSDNCRKLYNIKLGALQPTFSAQELNIGFSSSLYVDGFLTN